MHYTSRTRTIRKSPAFVTSHGPARDRATDWRAVEQGQARRAAVLRRGLRSPRRLAADAAVGRGWKRRPADHRLGPAGSLIAGRPIPARIYTRRKPPKPLLLPTEK